MQKPTKNDEGAKLKEDSEIRKTNAETEKLKEETRLLKYEAKRRHLKNVATIISGIGGLGILTFFFLFFLTPMTDLKLREEKIKLIEEKEKAVNLQLMLKEQKLFTDSLNTLVVDREKLLENKVKEIDSLNAYSKKMSLAINRNKKRLEDCGLNISETIQEIEISDSIIAELKSYRISLIKKLKEKDIIINNLKNKINNESTNSIAEKSFGYCKLVKNPDGSITCIGNICSTCVFTRPKKGDLQCSCLE